MVAIACHAVRPACLRKIGRMESGPGAVLVYCRRHCSSTWVVVKVQSSLGCGGMGDECEGSAHEQICCSSDRWERGLEGGGGVLFATKAVQRLSREAVWSTGRALVSGSAMDDKEEN
jgi:hypothetical protein